jgi:C4-dicarboxylate-specific signal transduction histidine kinase
VTGAPAESPHREHLLATLTERAQMASVGMMSEGVLQEIKREIAHIKLRAAIVMVQARRAHLTQPVLDHHRQTLDLHFEALENILDNVRRHLENEEIPAGSKAKLSDAVDFVSCAKAQEMRDSGIEIAYGGPDPEIDIVMEDICLVVLNLVQNAIDSMRGGYSRPRTIRIAAEDAGDGMLSVSVDDFATRSGVQVPVKSGFAAFSSPRFQEDATRRYRLAICKWILEDCGGTLSLAGTPEAGYGVRFQIPAG